VRYVHMEVGHAGQNLFLQAQALRLGTVVVGAFDDDKVSEVLNLDSDIQPLSLMPVGRK
jgi:nitroreductase